jgi:glycosyltransferase involved in cell wall biosynthesis
LRRVLYVNASGELAGAEIMLVDLVARLERARWEPLVVLPDAGALSAALDGVGVPWRVWPLATLRARRELTSPAALVRAGLRLPRSALALARLIRREGVALVHTNSSAVLDGALAARLAGVPHVWHVRELVRGPWFALRPVVRALSARVLCTSRAVAAHVGGPGAGLVVVPDGVACRAASAFPQGAHTPPRAWPWPPGAPVVGMIARINGLKGHDDFIEAAARVRAHFPEARFVIGGGALPAYAALEHALHARARELGLADVAFLGTLTRDEVQAVLAGLNVFVMPSRVVEGFGIAALEAIAEGVPVVATGGGPEEFVTPGETGLLIPRGDPAALADAVGALLADPARAQMLGRAGQARVCREFTLERHVATVEAVYRELVSER